MVIGNDQLVNLKKWKNINYILDEVKILCFNRKIVDNIRLKSDLKGDIEFVENFNINISSSEVRNSLLNKSIGRLNSMLNNGIIKYIEKEKIYV